jgi:gamma-glutamyltranspeptidase/glutathione hydrolase
MRKMRTLLLMIVMIISACMTKSYGQDLTWYGSGNGGIVAAGPKPSAQAGIDMLAKGGNAIDGAAATLFNLMVSDYGMFCFGGEVPFMFYNAKTGKVTVFNGMGVAPKDPAAIEWYYKNGIPKRGILAATCPGAVSAILTALEQQGTMSFEQVLAPTLALLDAGGKDWYPNMAKTLRRMLESEKNTKGTREQKIRAARDRFYKGDIADELNKFFISSGSKLRKADLETYQTKVEEPISINYRGYTVYKCNTWTQGAVLLQSLRLLEHFDIKSMGFFSPDYIHVTTEAMKLAYADRDKYYGDPAFVKVPLKELLSDQYTKIRYPLIDMKKASDKIRPGDPIKMIADAGPGESAKWDEGTTTCTVVDKWGNAVAATPSANPEYGLCPDLGIAFGTRLSSLNTQKGHPNCIEPGKRPRITLTPTMVLKNGKPIFVMSVAGGDMQDETGLQLMLQVMDFGRMPKEAIPAPRFYTYHIEDSFSPAPSAKERFLKINTLDVNTTEQSTIDELKKRGHIVNVVTGPIASPVMIYVDQASGMYYGAALQNKKFVAAINK